MWYVIQVASGQEQKARDLIEKAARGVRDAAGKLVVKECFVPRYLVEQKFKGAYRTVERVLFPGYVIAITGNVGALNGELAKVPAFTRLLGGGESFVPLDRSEMALIDTLTSDKRRVVEVSRAVAEGDSVKVVDGPLLGCEGWIRKVNRRKGTCLVETEMFGRVLKIEIGLVVVSKG